jgi:Ca-activated chloride channel family protein
MTELSNGFAMSISNADDISGQLMLAKGKISHAAMRDVTIEVDGVRSKDLVTPALSNTLYHGQQLTVLGHYYKAGEASVKLTGTINGEKKTYTTRFNLPEQASHHPELERLWAFTAIEELQAKMDYLGNDKDSEQAIVDTAVEYGLVTDYTSMLVVREEVFKALNIQRTNKARTDKENTARELRLNSTIQSQQYRVDQKKPMFVDHSTAQPSSSQHFSSKQGPNNSAASQPAQSQQRASVQPSRSGSGGGAVSPWLVIFIAAAIALVQLRRFKK